MWIGDDFVKHRVFVRAVEHEGELDAQIRFGLVLGQHELVEAELAEQLLVQDKVVAHDCVVLQQLVHLRDRVDVELSVLASEVQRSLVLVHGLRGNRLKL